MIIVSERVDATGRVFLKLYCETTHLFIMNRFCVFDKHEVARVEALRNKV